MSRFRVLLYFVSNKSYYVSSDKRFYLLHDQPRYQVSRNAGSGDFVLSDDTSISRSHAAICPHRDHVELMDTGSKYGTFVNGNIDTDVPMENHVAVKVYLNDR